VLPQRTTGQRRFLPAPISVQNVIKVAGTAWLIRSIEAGTMASLATDPNTTRALTLLHMHSTLERISISLDLISELENLIQATSVSVMKSHALIARCDEVCKHVWEVKSFDS
jgi:hypothetical protein